MNTTSERLKSDLNLYQDTIGHIENIILTSFEKEVRPLKSPPLLFLNTSVGQTCGKASFAPNSSLFPGFENNAKSYFQDGLLF